MEHLTNRIIKAARAHGEQAEPFDEIRDLQRALKEFSIYIPVLHADRIETALEKELEFCPEEETNEAADTL
jgi:hypothetical protein